MIKNNRNNEQIYGRNDMIMLDPNNKIYGSLGLADNYVMKTEEGTKLTLSNPKLGSFDDVLTEFNIYGMSKQESTTGANLIDIDNMLNECLVKNADDTYSILKTETNRFSKNFPINLKAGTAVRFDADVIEYNGTYSIKLQVSFGGQQVSTGGLIFLKNDVTGVTIYQDGSNDVGTYTKFKNAILSVGEAKVPYEPYTGGKPSPSPEYPQEIVSVGGNGSIEVNVRGKNLTDIYGYSAVSIENLENKRALSNKFGTILNTTEKTDKLIVNQEILDGAIVGSYKSGYFVIGINQKFEDRKDYIITFRINVLRNPLSASRVEVSFNGINFSHGDIIRDKVIVKASYTEYGERQYVEIRNNGMSLEVSDFMITEEDENTIYEPYHEPQTIYINTPIGVSAISVASGGNITIGGQQYIADYVDVERGKLVKKLKSFTISDIKAISTWGINENADNITGFYFYTSENGLPKTNNDVMTSTILRYADDVWGGKNVGCAMSSGGYDNYAMLSVPTNMLEDISSDENACASLVKICENTNAIFFYSMAFPIETDLTPEEIEQYKKLSVKAQTTIIENNYDAWMKATYKSTESV